MRAIGVQIAARLAGKEMTCNEIRQWVTGGRAPNSPYNYTLHVVVVVGAAGIAGLQRGIEIGALPADSAKPTKETIVGKLRSTRRAIRSDDVLDKD